MSVILRVYAFLGQRSNAVSFLRNMIFLWMFFFSSLPFAVTGRLIPVEAHRALSRCAPRLYWNVQLISRSLLSLPQCNSGLGSEWLTHSQYHIYTLMFFFLLQILEVARFPRTLVNLAFNIPHQAHSKTSVCKRFAFDSVCYSHTNTALCIWGIRSIFRKKKLFFKQTMY